MKIHIDREGCIECGACEETCPEVFRLEEGERAKVIEQYQTAGPDEGEVGSDLASCATEAAESCPVEVISIE